MLKAPKFYLVTLVDPFFAPDGKRYMAVFGVGKINLEDSGPFIRIGNTFIPADSIHTIIETTTIPPVGNVTEWITSDDEVEQVTRPSMIYICPPEED